MPKGGNGKPGSSDWNYIDGSKRADILNGTDSLTIKDLIFGRDGDDQIHGGDGDDKISGGNGNDQIWGDGGNDTLYGDSGNDTLWGGTGDDLLQGGYGSDYMNGETGACDVAAFTELHSTTSDPYEFGGLVFNTAEAADDPTTPGADNVYAYIVTNPNAGIAASTDPNKGDIDFVVNVDVLVGTNYNDVMNGGSHADVFDGAYGNDVIYGGGGADTLCGGADADTFVYLSATEGGDTLADFSGSGGDGDKIDLTALDLTAGGTVDPIADGFLFTDGTGTQLFVDLDGGGTADGTGDDVLLATTGGGTIDLGTDVLV